MQLKVEMVIEVELGSDFEAAKEEQSLFLAESMDIGEYIQDSLASGTVKSQKVTLIDGMKESVL